jgi:hypothetical protein
MLLDWFCDGFGWVWVDGGNEAVCSGRDIEGAFVDFVSGEIKCFGSLWVGGGCLGFVLVEGLLEGSVSRSLVFDSMARSGHLLGSWT